MLHQVSYAQGIEIRGPISDEFAEILTPAGMEFVALLERTFRDRREELLQRRARRRAEIDAGNMPDFLPVLATMCLVPFILLRNGENTTFMGRTGSEMEDLFTASAPIALQNKSCLLI